MASGWLYEGEPLPRWRNDDMVLIVSDDGYVRGVTQHDPGTAGPVLRMDADVDVGCCSVRRSSMK